MPFDDRRDLTAGQTTIPDVGHTIGVLYDPERRDRPGRGAAIALPAVLELLALIESGNITPAEARAAFTPVLDNLDSYHAEMDELRASH